MTRFNDPGSNLDEFLGGYTDVDPFRVEYDDRSFEEMRDDRICRGHEVVQDWEIEGINLCIALVFGLRFLLDCE